MGRVIFSPNNILDVFPLRGCLSSRLRLENKFLQPAAIRSDGLTTEALDLARGADMERVREFKGGCISQAFPMCPGRMGREFEGGHVDKGCCPVCRENRIRMSVHISSY